MSALSATDIAKGRAFAIAHTMRTEAQFEGKGNHIKHVEHQIEYANAVGEATFQRMQAWVQQEVPKMIQQEIDKYLQSSQVQVKVDEHSFAEAKRKISDLFRSIFH